MGQCFGDYDILGKCKPMLLTVVKTDKGDSNEPLPSTNRVQWLWIGGWCEQRYCKEGSETEDWKEKKEQFFKDTQGNCHLQ